MNPEDAAMALRDMIKPNFTSALPFPAPVQAGEAGAGASQRKLPR